MKYQWLLFDFDNTLVDFTNSSHLSFADLVAAHGIEEDPEMYSRYQKVNFQVWKDFEEEKIDALQLRRLRFELFMQAEGIIGEPLDWNAQYLDGLVKHAVFIEGAKELLDHFHGKFKLGIITNGLKEVQRRRLAKLEMTDYFDVIVVSDEINVAKPQAGFFDHTLNEIGTERKDHLLIIGDSLHSDIIGGNNYGIDTCWFNPNQKTNDSSIRPTYEINTLHNLSQILKQH